MLKGILFIIAIIVTFDIGKALINSYREEHGLVPAKEIQQKRKPPETSTSEKTTGQESADESLGTDQADKDDKDSKEEGSEDDSALIYELKPPDSSMNLTLPEDSSEDASEQEANGASSGSSSKSTLKNKDKSLNIKASPNVTFDEETGEPDVRGVTVEVKKPL